MRITAQVMVGLEAPDTIDLGLVGTALEEGAGGCIEPTGRVPDQKGYHRFMRDGKVHAAHRYAWELVHGPIPSGWHVHHLCENRACVNPAHLQALSPREHKRAHHAMQTHCPHGHEWTSENTYWNSRGCRLCRTCARERARRDRRAKGVQPRWPS